MKWTVVSLRHGTCLGCHPKVIKNKSPIFWYHRIAFCLQIPMICLNFVYDLTWPRKSTFSGQKLAFSWFCSTDVKNDCFQKWRYWLVLSLSWLYWPLGIQWRCLFFRNNITWRHYDVKFLILSLKSQFFWFLTLYSIQFNDVFCLKCFLDDYTLSYKISFAPKHVEIGSGIKNRQKTPKFSFSLFSRPNEVKSVPKLL